MQKLVLLEHSTHGFNRQVRTISVAETTPLFRLKGTEGRGGVGHDDHVTSLLLVRCEAARELCQLNFLSRQLCKRSTNESLSEVNVGFFLLLFIFVIASLSTRGQLSTDKTP